MQEVRANMKQSLEEKKPQTVENCRRGEQYEVVCYGTGEQSRESILKALVLRIYREQSKDNGG